uniref:Salivary secreted peptide n=1 Tax=Heliothis virescens TaxID=7102 RepID=A0A2A4JGD8_HELVI
MRSLLVVMLLAAAATASYVNTDMAEAPEMLVTYEEVDGTTVADVPVTAVATRRNISVGTIGNSRLLARTAHIRGAVAGARHVQDITFRTNSAVRITAIRVRHVGTVQGATSAIRSGGVGSTFVTIRLQSAIGRGYHYTIEVYGR